MNHQKIDTPISHPAHLFSRGDERLDAPSSLRRVRRRLRAAMSFWTVLPLTAAIAFTYFFGIADPLFVSEAVISIRHKETAPSGVDAVLGRLSIPAGSGNDDAALAEFVRSHEMLDALDRTFSLSAALPQVGKDPLSRLAKDASREDLLKFFRRMVEIDIRHDVGLVTLRVQDYDPRRAQAINEAIIGKAEEFMNALSQKIAAASLKFARAELNEAVAEANQASPLQREASNLRLIAAQQALAGAASVVGRQQVFIVRISNPSLPSEATRPARLLNTLAVTVLAGIIYLVAFLLWANVKDHRTVR